MQAYQENISAKVNGVLTPILGVKVTVTDDATGHPATLFSDNGITQITSDIVTDETGYFGFFAANGSYTVKFSSPQIKLAPRNIDLYDPLDDAPLTQAQAAASSGASKIGIGAETVENALNALQLADYIALRAYTGPRQSVYVTGYLGTSAPSGIAGMFVRDDSDTTTTDNGGTVIVSTNGKRWKRRHNGIIRSAWFGTVADWNGTTGTDNTSTLTAALAHMVTRGGGQLVIDPGDYYFGAHTASDIIVSVTGLANTRIMAYGARFIANSAADCTPFLLVFNNPNNVVLAGARFLDIGFNPASWQTHSRWGMAAVNITASVASTGFKMLDCVGDNLTYLLVGDFSASSSRRLMKNIEVQDCRLTNAYYGVDLLYAGDNLKVDNLICKDVRRGCITYGARNADIDIKLYTSQGFLGSNAFVELACEGTALNADNNVENVRIRLNVTGYEAHINYVNFYHQQADSAGWIANVDAQVFINNLNSTGKAAGITATNIYQLMHEDPVSGNVIGNTSRTYKQIKLDAEVVGSITGLPVVVSSVNLSSPAQISLSPGLTDLAQTYTLYALTNPTNVNLLTPFARALTSLSPIGGTTAGAPTGLVSNGAYTKIGKMVSGFAQISWTGHTGTGQLRLNGLPFPIDTTLPNPAVTIIGSGLSHTAGATLVALLGGSANQQVLIYEENAGNLAVVNMDTSVSGIYITFAYFTP